MVQITLRNSEGALERILGKMRFRGLQLSKLMVDASDDGGWLEVTCKMASSPRVTAFTKQCQQMFDVKKMEIYGALAKAQ